MQFKCSVSVDTFNKGMKSPDCFHILVNCMKNIEVKIKVCEMNPVTQDNQTKGEGQLRDLNKSMKFYNEMFNELQRDNRKKKEEINELEKNTRKIDQKD